MQNDNVITIFQLTSYLKRNLENNINLKDIQIKGEISNLSIKNHIYFDLKDNYSKISCFLDYRYKKDIDKYKNGDEIILKGDVSVYLPLTKIQINVKEFKHLGLGDLYYKFELLKKELSELGYFREDLKQKIPFLPSKIAVVVGENSAAYSDIKKSFNKRYPIAKVDYYFSLVQGNEAAKDIIKNLKKIDSLGYDAIILARGGGSSEDLWAFNDRDLAITIFNLKTFIITGIGHEQDYTIADYVSDFRAITPTAAVENITIDINDIINNIKHQKIRIYKNINNNLSKFILDVKNYKLIIQTKKENILNLKNKVNKTKMLLKLKLLNNLETRRKEFLNKNLTLKNQIMNILVKQKNLVNRFYIILNAYNPKNVLSKGYALIYKENKILKNTKNLKINDNLDLVLNDGKLKVRVEEIVE